MCERSCFADDIPRQPQLGLHACCLSPGKRETGSLSAHNLQDQMRRMPVYVIVRMPAGMAQVAEAVLAQEAT